MKLQNFDAISYFLFYAFTHQKNDQRPLHVLFEYNEVLMMTQNIGTPHPMIATPNTAEQIRVTMCT